MHGRPGDVWIGRALASGGEPAPVQLLLALSDSFDCLIVVSLPCSMVWGVPVTLAVGAACYLLLLVCTRRLGR